MKCAQSRGAWTHPSHYDWASLRRLLTVGLVLGLGVFGLEIAVHSAHHLSDQGASAQCFVAAASAHSVATASGSSAVECPLMSVADTQAVIGMARVEVPSLRAHRGRAPPVTSF